MPMEGRCPNSQYIYSNVRFRELSDAVPRKGLSQRGDKKIEKNDIFVNATYLCCYLVGRGVYYYRIPKQQNTPPKTRIRDDDTTGEEKVAIEYVQNGKDATDDVQNKKVTTDEIQDKRLQ